LPCRQPTDPIPNIPLAQHYNNPSIIDTTSTGEIVSYESGTIVYYPNTANSSSGGTGQLGNGTSAIYLAAISTNRTSLSYPGREINVTWNLPGHVTGWDGKYKTASTAGSPKYALWVAQLNATYTPLYNIDLNTRTATTYQPNGTVFPPEDFTQVNITGASTNYNGIVNGTMFVAITDTNLPVTPYNLSLVNPHVVAGPALYQAD